MFHPAMLSFWMFLGMYPVEVSGWTTAPLFGRVGLSEVVFGLHPGCHASEMFQSKEGLWNPPTSKSNHFFWANYSDRFPPKGGLVREISYFRKSRLVKYYNLARSFHPTGQQEFKWFMGWISNWFVGSCCYWGSFKKLYTASKELIFHINLVLFGDSSSTG